ncbi:hypothetical protein AK812_SmicGene48147, partial [Symbiodinium microadriaticum]
MADVLEMVQRFHDTAQQNEPTTASREAVPETRPFAGQGYTLGEDAPASFNLDDMLKKKGINMDETYDINMRYEN